MDVAETLLKVIITNHPDPKILAAHWEALLPTMADAGFDLQLDVPFYKDTYQKKLAEFSALLRLLADNAGRQPRP
ncbi:hypothetical protein CSC64_06750 [Pseudoxanthomonas koreensis]|nr:hypothetical protein CSC64_06750 [Pseudoxanthomonas koreensis]